MSLLYIKNHVIIEIKLSTQSKSPKDFIVLFNRDLSHFIKGLSLRSNLNLLECAAKTSKLSKFIVQLFL